MFVRNICYPVTSLGPGNRLAIWLTGCKKNCPGCMSPELRIQLDDDKVPISLIKDIIGNVKAPIDGVTISGGEPLDQLSELDELIDYIFSSITRDILLYSGYSYPEIMEKCKDYELLSKVATLIAGDYQVALNNGRGLRGSSNQTVHRLKNNNSYDYENAKRRRQVFVFDDKAVLVGLRGANG